MSRAGRFGAALGMLWAAHDVGDHVAQTDAQARDKPRDYLAMTGHLATYTGVQACGIAALRPLGVRPRIGRVLAAVAWSVVTHALLDTRRPVTWLLEHTGSPRFAHPQVEVWHAERGDLSTGPLPLHGPYLADQALHHAALTVSALILAGGDR